MDHKLRKGIVQVYTGNGKGKTTAAFGLALRAAGAGLSISIHQFAKGRNSGEFKMVKKLPNIKVCKNGKCSFIHPKSSARDRRLAGAGIDKAAKDVFSGKYDIVILDEINIALKMGLVKERDILSIIEKKPAHVELIMTGRYCPKSVLDRADLITEMRQVRHPYAKRIMAREGIEY